MNELEVGDIAKTKNGKYVRVEFIDFVYEAGSGQPVMTKLYVDEMNSEREYWTGSDSIDTISELEQAIKRRETWGKESLK